MKLVKVYFQSGAQIITNINGTLDEIRRYYVGRWFNLGVVEDDMHFATNVIICN